MVYPPGEGRSGPYLMELWRRYLEQYADHEGDVEQQIVAALYHTAEVLGILSSLLDRSGRYRRLIGQRTSLFKEGSEQARVFGDCLITGAFSIYNHLNTLAHLFMEGNRAGQDLIRQVDRQIRSRVETPGQIERAAAALNAAFALLSLVTISLDPEGQAVGAIRQVEQRFIGGSEQTTSSRDRLLNALYRLVEMMQLFVALSDSELQDQAMQIATRFEEEDRARDPLLKMRNGFCRFFELGHLITTHLAAVL